MLESLISINNKLQQKEAASGLLEYAMKKHEGEIRVQERWHEKLHDWERALEAYRRKESSQPQQQDSDLILGQMRCLEALCEWGQLHSLASSQWNQVSFLSCFIIMDFFFSNLMKYYGNFKKMGFSKSDFEIDQLFLRSIMTSRTDLPGWQQPPRGVWASGRPWRST